MFLINFDNQKPTIFVIDDLNTRINKSYMRFDSLYLLNKLNDKTIIERVSDYNTESYSRLDTLYMFGAMIGVSYSNI